MLLLFLLFMTCVSGQIPGFKMPGVGSLPSLKTDDKYLVKAHLAGNEVKLLKLPGDSSNGLVGGITSGIANTFAGSNLPQVYPQQPLQQQQYQKAQIVQTPVISNAVQVCDLIAYRLSSCPS